MWTPVERELVCIRSRGMKYYLDVSPVRDKNIYELDDRFRGVSAAGEEISFTNYYMEQNHRPYFGISGEMHFSRISDSRWEDELLKMKMCGINTVATYLFWIHHEEEEGVFDFTGQRDLRKFILLCQKHSLNVILRIGPYSHGECRNGGFPDWLFGMPFEMRKISDGFLFYVKRYFEEIGRQTKGLYFKDGGPCIAVQIDNEYMHSSSIWDFSRGVNREFVFGGDEGDVYMEKIKEIALSCGIEPVFFTATAWGGAVTPESMMPMWGGYAFRPWMLFEDGTHPQTDEYVYQDFHRNGVETTYDFHPHYQPETRPYSCCEIGAGMMVGYNYRFQYPYKSVDAIANIKIASGCNFLGYYMYHGGSHPLGRSGAYMNDGSLPKISYDYQAAIGEYGQVRESARRTKSIHYFAKAFGEQLCGLQTVLPDGASGIQPQDMEMLRFAVRTDGRRGFLFINNFQDHARMPDRTEEEVTLKLRDGELTFSINIAGDENAILPFHFDMDGIELVKATAQPLTVLSDGGMKTYVFFVPSGMDGAFEVEQDAVMEGYQGNVFRFSPKKRAQVFYVSKGSKRVRILVLTRQMADWMYIIRGNGLVFTEDVALEDEKGVRIETSKSENLVYTFPKELELQTDVCRKMKAPDLPEEMPEEIPEEMNEYLVACEMRECKPVLTNTAPHRYTVEIPKECFTRAKDVILKIDYIGDIGNAFLKHRLISDNYSNGQIWEIGLSDYRHQLGENKLVLYISPIKEGARIIIDNQMAAVRETVEKTSEKIKDIWLEPVYDIKII